MKLVRVLVAISIALALGGVAILAVGENPLRIYAIMLRGAFGSTFALFTTLTRATPIIICGLGAAVAWKSGYQGIGGEGQMIWGGFIAATVAVHFPGPPAMRILLAVMFALLAGGIWSLISAVLADRFKVSLVISTLLMNFIADIVVWHFLARMQVARIPAYMHLPRFVPHHTLHYGFIFALLLVILTWFLLNRTSFGYESRMTGLNLNFTNYGGVSGKKVMYGILILSGVICAFAGVVEVFGVNYRYMRGAFTSASFAWVGLAAALVSNFHPAGILFTSIFLAGISTGSAAVARATDVPIGISTIIQGAILLFISTQLLRTRRSGTSKQPDKEMIDNDRGGWKNSLRKRRISHDRLRKGPL